MSRRRGNQTTKPTHAKLKKGGPLTRETIMHAVRDWEHDHDARHYAACDQEHDAPLASTTGRRLTLKTPRRTTGSATGVKKPEPKAGPGGQPKVRK